MQFFYACFVVGHMLPDKLPETFLVVFVFYVCEFMYNNIIDESYRQFHQHRIETDDIFGRTAAPLPFRFSETDRRRGKAHLLCMLCHYLGQYFFSLFFVESIDLSMEDRFVILAVKDPEAVGIENKTGTFLFVWNECQPDLFSEKTEHTILPKIRFPPFFFQYSLLCLPDPFCFFEQQLFQVVLRHLWRFDEQVPRLVEREVGMPQSWFDDVNILGQESGHAA